MKQWNCCCCFCDLGTAAVIVGWIYSVRHPILLFFSQNVLLPSRGAAISYFRHESIHFLPNNFIIEILVLEKVDPCVNQIVLKIKCSKIRLYYLTVLETLHRTLSRVVNLNRIC